ncbi:MAG: hypothetical protein C4308_11125 [Chitinophagaceae bacterium]
MKKTLSLLLISSVILLSCKKDKQSTKEKLQGKWTMKSIVENHYYSGSSHIHTYPASPGDYLDFRSNNTVIISLGGSVDTLTYGLPDDNHLWIDDPAELYEIKTLTKSQFVIANRDDDPNGDYYEVTINMEK